MSDASTEVGALIARKYRIVEISYDGVATSVAIARHEQLGHEVAIKFLKAEGHDADARVRFAREGKLLARLTNEHVARVLDVGDTEPPFIVMERLAGTDLGELLDEHEELPVEQAVTYVLQAIEGLAEAHAKHIVHRDVKPSNLFLTERSGGAPVLKVLDFGIAKALGPDNRELMTQGTVAGALLGSPCSLSPEQVRDSSDVDPRTDVWGLGCTLYELITGQPPFDADTLSALCAKIVTESHRPMAELVDDVPAALDRVIARCLEKNRADRYANVVELGFALTPFAPEEAFEHVERAAHLLGIEVPTMEEGTAVPAVPLHGWSGRTVLGAAAVALALAGLVVAATADRATPSKTPSPARAPATTAAKAAPSPTHAPLAPSVTPQPEVEPTSGATSTAMAVAPRPPPPGPCMVWNGQDYERSVACSEEPNAKADSGDPHPAADEALRDAWLDRK
jgi:serine/threonine-protein kinase